jgi:hypothetical protein
LPTICEAPLSLIPRKKKGEKRKSIIEGKNEGKEQLKAIHHELFQKR